MKTSLVLGVNGQDGSYMAEELISRGHMVIGIGRQIESRWISPSSQFRYLHADLSDIQAYETILNKLSPDVVCHFAAVHGSSGFSYLDQWKRAFTVNAMITQATLEYQRKQKSDCSLYFLSSSKVFKNTPGNLVNESSERSPNCLYSISKNFSTDLIQYYRREHGLKASVFWTFNHESPRRGNSYFVPTIVGGLAGALLHDPSPIMVQSLDFNCDWGSAQEYMNIIADVIDKDIADDFVLATGRPMFARQLVENLFAQFGLTGSKHVHTSNNEKLGSDTALLVDTTHIFRTIGRKPRIKIEDVCLDILRNNHPEALRDYLGSKETNLSC